MFIKEVNIDDGFDIDSVRSVFLFDQYALFADVIDKTAIAVRDKEFGFSARQGKRKLNFCKEIAESLTCFCRNHNELTLGGKYKRAAAEVAFVEYGYYGLIGTAESRKQIHCNIKMLGTALIGSVANIQNNRRICGFFKS